VNHFLLDASALVKRYYAEVGAALVDHLFAQAAPARLACLMLGAAEVAAALARKRNGGVITPTAYVAAMARLGAEVLNAAHFLKLPADNALIEASLPLLDKHAINATDAVLLRAALDAATHHRAGSNDLVLVTADQRLLNAAQAEGLLTFDPERQVQADLDSLLGP
jgi:predicted nucleic acid-binding protein